MPKGDMGQKSHSLARHNGAATLENNSALIERLIHQQPLISQQVTLDQVCVILRELAGALERSHGAVVELGCYIGTTSLYVRRLLDELESPREFHVYDSFEGLPAKAPEDASAAGEQFIAGELAVSKKQLLHEFKKAGLQPPIIHKGWFADLTTDDMPATISFAFLDGDFYDSMVDSLRLVLPRMAPGGCIVIDDYAREALPGVARAVHAFGLSPTISHNLGIVHL